MTLRPGGTAFVPTDQKLDDLKLLVDELYNCRGDHDPRRAGYRPVLC